MPPAPGLPPHLCAKGQCGSERRPVAFPTRAGHSDGKAGPAPLLTAERDSVSRAHARCQQSRSLVRGGAGRWGCLPEPTDALASHGHGAQPAGAVPARWVPEALGCPAGKRSHAPPTGEEQPLAFQTTSRSCRPASARAEPLTFPSGRRTCSLSPPRHPRSLGPPQVLADDSPVPEAARPRAGHRRRAPVPSSGRAGAGSPEPRTAARRPPPGMLLPDVRCLLSLLFS